MELKTVGKSTTRTDAKQKVTGALKYAFDQSVYRQLHGKLYRSEYARAAILNVDTAEALSVPGVVFVFCAQNMPSPMPRFGSVRRDQPILADGEVHYFGEPIAIVLAESEQAAAQAVALIKVEYQPMEPVCCLEDALRGDAPTVNGFNAMNKQSVNIFDEYHYGWGNANRMMDKAHLVVEDSYDFPMIHHFPLEPFNCVAYPDTDGVVIKSPIQHPFTLRRVVAACLDMKIAKVRVIASSLGGGFGGKGYPKLEPLIAYLALRVGRPIRIVLSMTEGFYCSRRLSSTVKVKLGFAEDGTIIAGQVNADYLIGAYVDAAPRVVAKASYLGCGPYRIPNIAIDARAVMSNTTPATAFRGFGMPQIMWALESQMNEAAEKLGIDGLEIRLRNLPNRGETLIPGDNPVDGEWSIGLKKAAELVGWGGECDVDTGRGISIGIKCPIPGTVSHAIIKLHVDGSATVAVGTTEMGQGSRTVMAQISSEILGIPIDEINIIMGDTATTGFDIGTVASRSTVAMGNAVADGCLDILKQMNALAAEYFKTDANKVSVANGVVHAEDKMMSYADFLRDSVTLNQGEIVARGLFKGLPAPDHPLGGLSDFWEIIFTAVEASVDRETGEIRVRKLANVSDVGKVINPIMAKGQEEGAGLMGLGHTLMEQMIYNKEGKLVNGGPLDYRVPTIQDIPDKMLSAFIENEDGPGHFGSKGLGESGVIAVAPAVARAIYDAVGVKISDLPLTSERVWTALQK